MNQFGKTLFSGSKFIYWILTPFILISLVAISFLPFFIPEWNSLSWIILIAAWITGILLIIGMSNPLRFSWASRILTAMVFLLYVVYVINTLKEHNWKFTQPYAKAESDPIKAILGLLIIGFPSLFYTVLGRFTIHKDEDVDDNDDSI